MPRAAVVTIIRPPVRAVAPGRAIAAVRVSAPLPPPATPRKATRPRTPVTKTPTPITPAVATPSLPDDAPEETWPAVLHTKLLFSVTEAARLLSLSRSKTYLLVRDGRLRHVDIDAAVRITAQDLAAFIRDLRAAS